MITSPYDYMQMAVDIVATSPHPTNKIAATLVCADPDQNGAPHVVRATNFWPKRIEDTFGHDTKIGNSSGTIHAETACIFLADQTRGAQLYITDPPCPNCAKNVAEAGIKTLYIDHKGFLKDFAERRGGEFETMSMRIFEHAGVSVYELHRKEQRLVPVLEIPEGYAPITEHPLQIESFMDQINQDNFIKAIKGLRENYGEEPFALALAQDKDGKAFLIHARRHPAIGYTHHDDLTKEGKYSYILQPVNRLLVGSKFYELKILPDYLHSSRVPTAREFVNIVGAGVTSIYLSHDDEARDEFAIKALNQLTNAHILQPITV